MRALPKTPSWIGSLRSGKAKVSNSRSPVSELAPNVRATTTKAGIVPDSDDVVTPQPSTPIQNFSYPTASPRFTGSYKPSPPDSNASMETKESFSTLHSTETQYPSSDKEELDINNLDGKIAIQGEVAVVHTPIQEYHTPTAKEFEEKFTFGERGVHQYHPPLEELTAIYLGRERELRELEYRNDFDRNKIMSQQARVKPDKAENFEDGELTPTHKIRTRAPIFQRKEPATTSTSQRSPVATTADKLSTSQQQINDQQQSEQQGLALAKDPIQEAFALVKNTEQEKRKVEVAYLRQEEQRAVYAHDTSLLTEEVYKLPKNIEKRILHETKDVRAFIQKRTEYRRFDADIVAIQQQEAIRRRDEPTLPRDPDYRLPQDEERRVRHEARSAAAFRMKKLEHETMEIEIQKQEMIRDLVNAEHNSKELQKRLDIEVRDLRYAQDHERKILRDFDAREEFLEREIKNLKAKVEDLEDKLDTEEMVAKDATDELNLADAQRQEATQRTMEAIDKEHDASQRCQHALALLSQAEHYANIERARADDLVTKISEMKFMFELQIKYLRQEIDELYEKKRQAEDSAYETAQEKESMKAPNPQAASQSNETVPIYGNFSPMSHQKHEREQEHASGPIKNKSIDSVKSSNNYLQSPSSNYDFYLTPNPNQNNIVSDDPFSRSTCTTLAQGYRAELPEFNTPKQLIAQGESFPEFDSSYTGSGHGGYRGTSSSQPAKTVKDKESVIATDFGVENIPVDQSAPGVVSSRRPSLGDRFKSAVGLSPRKSSFGSEAKTSPFSNQRVLDKALPKTPGGTIKQPRHHQSFHKLRADNSKDGRSTQGWRPPGRASSSSYATAFFDDPVSPLTRSPTGASSASPSQRRPIRTSTTSGYTSSSTENRSSVEKTTKFDGAVQSASKLAHSLSSWQLKSRSKISSKNMNSARKPTPPGTASKAKAILGSPINKPDSFTNSSKAKALLGSPDPSIPSHSSLAARVATANDFAAAQDDSTVGSKIIRAFSPSKQTSAERSEMKAALDTYFSNNDSLSLQVPAVQNVAYYQLMHQNDNPAAAQMSATLAVATPNPNEGPTFEDKSRGRHPRHFRTASSPAGLGLLKDGVFQPFT